MALEKVSLMSVVMPQYLLVMAALSFHGVQIADATKDNIPSGLPADLRELIEQTFSERLTLGTSGPEERAVAAERIGRMGERAAPAVPFLIRLLGDRRNSVQIAARDALVAIGQPALEACIIAARELPSPRQGEAILCLGKFGCPAATDALLELLKANDSETRRTVLIALMGCTDPRITPRLIEILDTAHRDERLFAAQCFTKLRDARSVEPLLRAAECKGPMQEFFEPGLRRAAVSALGCQRDRRAVVALLAVFRNPNEDVSLRYSAAQALGQIGDPGVLSTLIDTIGDDDAPVEVRSGAVLGVGAYRPSASEPFPKGWHAKSILALLSRILNNEKEPIRLRVCAAQAMGDFGDAGAVESLCCVADMHGHDELGFRASVSAVNLANGAIRDIGVLRALRNYEPDPEGGWFDDRREQAQAVEKLAGRGSWRVRLAIRGYEWLYFAFLATVVSVAAAGVGITCRLLQKYRTNRKRSRNRDTSGLC
jgi:HEAT repeat protein